MNTIVKRSGKEELFQRDKILDSMRGAGISQDPLAWLRLT